tara:strand:+ start:257 stop:532 length:276 start_codon:yes stop_codon:yes gene_type:complete
MSRGSLSEGVFLLLLPAKGSLGFVPGALKEVRVGKRIVIRGCAALERLREFAASRMFLVPLVTEAAIDFSCCTFVAAQVHRVEASRGKPGS